MSNQKISLLPRKYALALEDLLPIVDSQFGPENYINKKTTVGDLLALASALVSQELIALNPVVSVNGESGVVVLSINQLDQVKINAPLLNEFLVYDQVTSDWVNKNIEDIDFTFDCGSF